MNRIGNPPWSRNERGAVLPYIIVVVFFLSFIWILSLSRTTGDIKWLGLNREATDQFYAADTALNNACENHGEWMTDDFYADIESDPAAASLTLTMNDDHDEPLGTLTFRPIQDEDEAAATANNLPVQRHEVPPPEGSGFGMSKFVVKRFGIDASSPDASKQIQAGIWVLQSK